MTQPVFAAPIFAMPDEAVAEETITETRLDWPWRVILFNDEIHTFDDVIGQLVKATRCSFEHAEGVAWIVHTEGKAVAYEGEMAECLRVQGVLRQIELVTQIEG